MCSEICEIGSYFCLSGDTEDCNRKTSRSSATRKTWLSESVEVRYSEDQRGRHVVALKDIRYHKNMAKISS